MSEIGERTDHQSVKLTLLVFLDAIPSLPHPHTSDVGSSLRHTGIEPADACLNRVGAPDALTSRLAEPV